MYSYEEAMAKIREVLENLDPDTADDVFEEVEEIVNGYFGDDFEDFDLYDDDFEIEDSDEVD